MNQKSSFTDLALRTESRPEALQNLNRSSVYQLLLLMKVAGDVIDAAKRAVFYGKPLDKSAYEIALVELTDLAGELRWESGRGMENLPCTAGYDVNLRLLHATMGIFGEAGELAEALTKQMDTGELDLINVSEEAGDVDWYKQIVHDETGMSEDDVRAKIIAKLMKRYPGKFDAAAALNRDVAAERVALETTTA